MDSENLGTIKIFIRAYEKRGDGINAFLVYKIETKVKIFLFEYINNFRFLIFLVTIKIILMFGDDLVIFLVYAKSLLINIKVKAI